MNTWMREEREERAKPKKKQKEGKLEKFFTQAHINQGESKTVITIDYVKKHKEKMAKQILTSTSLKSAWEVIKEAPHVGDFLSWQITANLCELKLIKLKEDFTYNLRLLEERDMVRMTASECSRLRSVVESLRQVLADGREAARLVVQRTRWSRWRQRWP